MKNTNAQSQILNFDLLADAYREELKELAWLLCLMNQQQQSILRRDSSKILELNEEINQHTELLASLIEQRENLTAEYVNIPSCEAQELFKHLMKLLPEVLRPLFDAFCKEGRSLLGKIQRRSGQNQRILSRAMDGNEELIALFRPNKAPKTYTRAGRFRKSAFVGSVIQTAV